MAKHAPLITLFLLPFFLLIQSQAHAVDGISYTHPTEPTGFNLYIRAVTCYLEEGISGAHVNSCRSTSGGFIVTHQIPEAAKENLNEAKITNSDLFDLDGLLGWLNTWSYSLREHRQQLEIIPNTLSEFQNLTQYKTWDREIIDRSRAKHKTRVIYRSPRNFAPSMSVAETYDSITGDLSSTFIEAEIAINRIDGSGNSDFYSYNDKGQLSSTSLFPGGERPVPSMCLGCHYSRENGTFSRDNF